MDLYVSIQGRHRVGAGPQSGGDRVFRGLGGFEFEEVTERFGTKEDRAGLSFVATWFDADRDGALDVFTAKDRGSELVPTRLLIQPGEPDQEWTESSQGFELDIYADGMGVGVGDVQGDGAVEVVVSDNYGRIHIRSIEDGRARDVGPTWGAVAQNPVEHETTWAVEFADLDNDADLDLVAAFGRREYGLHTASMSNNLWEWVDEAGRFRERIGMLDQPPTSGLTAWRGVAPVDLDGDGTLELIYSSHVGPVSIQRTAPTLNRWVAIALDGPETNPDGLGAEVRVRAGSKVFVQWIGAGTTGVHSVREPVAHFGLGPSLESVAVEVLWPGGRLDSYDVELDTLNRLAY